MLVSNTASAKSVYDSKTTEISLPTVQCNMCRKTIEKALNKTKGIISSEVDIENKKAIVTYDDSKIDIAKIEKVITSAGYDANERKANAKAYEKLPDCCKIK